MAETPRNGPKSIGIGSCQFVGTALGIIGLASSGLGADLGPQIDGFRPESYKLAGAFKLSRVLHLFRYTCKDGHWGRGLRLLARRYVVFGGTRWGGSFWPSRDEPTRSLDSHASAAHWAF